MQNCRSSLVKPARRLRPKIWAIRAAIMVLMIANFSASKAAGAGDYSQGKTALRSGDYDKLQAFPRPGHADFVAHEKFGGFEDYRGGGHFSGRRATCKRSWEG